jgi:hypothetical protein
MLIEKIPIFYYWENIPSTFKPEYINLCHKTIEKHGNTESTQAILVTPSNLKELLPEIVLPDIYTNDFGGTANISVKVDYLRVKLVQKYGGMYIDSDTIVMKSLNWIKSYLEKYDFVGTTEHGKYYINGWFASRKNGEIINKWSSLIDKSISVSLTVSWTQLGSKILTPLINDNFSLAYIFTGNEICLYSYNQKDEFFKPNSINTDNSLCVVLYNTLFPEKIKKMTEKEILSSNMLLSTLFKRSLNADF